ncbi:MAG: TfuA-related McrA-glycine thioamidation protein [Methanimicrococcus sp.]|nr:TfuA-related McrA-glycine thioamidation protein [Methanimicrococcus sp.]
MPSSDTVFNESESAAGKIIVFLGPSLDMKTACQILPFAEFRPPASRGDIEKAISDGAKSICLIDGVFFEQCSVGHREILAALKKGIFVTGASSMGALRAFEMSSFGMVGIGQVYTLYKDGILESDDEVAIVCDPFSNVPLSEALVNIRETLKKAVLESVLTQGENDAFIQMTLGVYYPDRTYDYLIEKAKEDKIMAPPTLLKFEEWILEGNAVDIKKEDAISVLKFLSQK